jgi:hypothetical protein
MVGLPGQSRQARRAALACATVEYSALRAKFDPDQIGYCVAPSVVYPRLRLASIIYMPPGRSSSVSYSIGSGEGSATSYQTTHSSGFNAQLTIFGLGGGPTYSTSVVNGSTLTFSVIDTQGRTETVNSGVDMPARGGDKFDIWANPMASYYYSTANGYEQLKWSTSNGGDKTIYTYSADQLAGRAVVTDDIPQGRVQFFQNMKDAEKQALLAMDAPLNGANLDSRRYQRVDLQYNTPQTPVALLGPEYPGDPIETYNQSLAYNSQYDSINGSSVNPQGTLLYTSDFPIYKSVNGNVNVGYTWSASYSDTRTNSTYNQKNAALALQTSTIGCVMPVQIYIDSLFGTYLVLPVPGQTVNCQ